ncbi:MAG: pentapeptide repeat-containing protein [Acaryochloris sp. CRU_2_0]|nr:pentapeptide repeat-containing protein [Acaryochloris sp. CRU_2_0]
MFIRHANLKNANLTGARMEQTRFNHSNLTNANFTDANFNQTYFFAADLTGATFAPSSMKRYDSVQQRCQMVPLLMMIVLKKIVTFVYE